MLPHFLILYFTSALATVAQSRSFHPWSARLLWAAIILVLTLFAGWRGDTVGADTNGYVGRFEYLVAINVIWDTAGSADVGYKVLVAIARLLSDNPTSLLIVSSGVATILYVTAIYRLAQLPALALFVFIAFGIFVFHMNGLRQGIALGLFMHALPSMLGGRQLRAAAWIGAAATFHSSAILLLLAYPIFLARFSVLSVAVVSVAATITTVTLEPLLQLLSVVNERYVTYGQRTEVGATSLTLFHLLSTSVFVIGRPFVKREWRKDYERFLLLFFVGTIIYVIVQATGSYVEMTRMALYFTVTQTFLWPILIRSISDPLFRLLMLSIFVILGTLFYFIFLGQIGGYVPYVTR